MIFVQNVHGFKHYRQFIVSYFGQRSFVWNDLNTMSLKKYDVDTPAYTVKLVQAKLPANAGNSSCSSEVKRSLAQSTCVTCSLPVKTGNYTCIYGASTSRRIHAIALNKARKLQVTSPA